MNQYAFLPCNILGLSGIDSAKERNASVQGAIGQPRTPVLDRFMLRFDLSLSQKRYMIYFNGHFIVDIRIRGCCYRSKGRKSLSVAIGEGRKEGYNFAYLASSAKTNFLSLRSLRTTPYS